MNLPKVKFIDAPLSKEFDWMYVFLFENEWDWGKYIIKKHPKIKEIFLLRTEVEKVIFLKKYVIRFNKENRELIEINKANYQKEWEKIAEEFFNILSEIMQINWPENRKNIKAMMSLNPICPRFLKNWSFFIFYNYKKISDAIEVIMHESCHFLYFEKWKESFPRCNTRSFESPYLEWHLSEILAPIILNDSRIQKILKQKASFYNEHKKIKIEGKTVPKYFTILYNKSQKKDNFAEFLKEAYKMIKRNKELFKI